MLYILGLYVCVRIYAGVIPIGVVYWTKTPSSHTRTHTHPCVYNVGTLGRVVHHKKNKGQCWTLFIYLFMNFFARILTVIANKIGLNEIERLTVKFLSLRRGRIPRSWFNLSAAPRTLIERISLQSSYYCSMKTMHTCVNHMSLVRERGNREPIRVENQLELTDFYISFQCHSHHHSFAHDARDQPSWW